MQARLCEALQLTHWGTILGLTPPINRLFHIHKGQVDQVLMRLDTCRGGSRGLSLVPQALGHLVFLFSPASSLTLPCAWYPVRIKGFTPRLYHVALYCELK